ncbi:iron-containing redox enzyme family protein [Methylovorus menthalis]|uniref:iron-containing redox enzyme family protein n=1 Tax=Methylovorus menthalis TaxID=1002227 RepID=UPI001E3225D3|nr:iron-containing redox enzyme family protein [Methylovorus menthalis]MCB4809810.1 iron-containing redox enzyme family protein [Methylovorus menthalis]
MPGDPRLFDEEAATPPAPFEAPLVIKTLYFDLLNPDLPAERHVEASRQAHAFLTRQLAQIDVSSMDSDPDLRDAILADSPHALHAWIQTNAQATGRQYQEYLEGRKRGEPRRYFSCKSHALNFLLQVAPTKMVDGAWLYGLTRQWDDPRYASLIKTYLEELGEGRSDKNHVVLYQQLLRRYDLDTEWHGLDDGHFLQGLTQLALGHHAESFLPEVIGFNLAYEQLPLHLLITTHELEELNIDPYYFMLHVTVDNAMTGHAMRAAWAVFEALPRRQQRQAFMVRMLRGMALNSVGLATPALIKQFDPETEITNVFRKKASVGKFMHASQCKLGAYSINEWLSDPQKIPQLLHALVEAGWMTRNQDPAQSRFWKLVEGEHASMFGVFTPYEKQLMYDWMAGDALDSLPRQARLGEHWRKRGMTDSSGHPAETSFATLQSLIEPALLTQPSRQMHKMAKWLAPGQHHTSAGLAATRLYMQQTGMS